MTEKTQLTESLTVLWEGDLERYAEKISLWNRALALLDEELKKRRFVAVHLRALGAAALFLELLLDALAKVGVEVNGPAKPGLRAAEVKMLGEKLWILSGRGSSESDSEGTPSMFSSEALALLNNSRNKDHQLLVSNMEWLDPDDSAENPIRFDRTVSSDVRMTGWWRCEAINGLRIGLLWGLRSRSAKLAALKLINTGPAATLTLDPIGPRMNLLTGDNGLGKSFFLETLWFMLTGHWHNFPAVVLDVEKRAAIIARLEEGTQTEVRAAPWNRREQGWASPREHTFDVEPTGYYEEPSLFDRAYSYPIGAPSTIDPGLVVYARVDGSFSVWDSHRNVDRTRLRDGVALPAPRVFSFGYGEVLHGLKVWLDDKNEREVSLGLINEWREWQLANKPQFELLKRILAALGPEGEPLTPGTPSRPYLDDAKDIPTIQMGYGQEVPITLAPAGVKRAVMLAYVLTWAISEHRRLVTAQGGLPARSVVLLIDEPETHLHPRWQRTILPSLLKALEVGFGEPKVDVQMFVATHSPLVLASLEPHFDPALDALWKLDLVNGEVKLERDVWHKRGDANAWLTSDVFDMSSSRSVEAEKALKRAKALALRGTATPEEIAEVQAELARSLTDTDRAWRAWESFVEHLGTQR